MMKSFVPQFGFNKKENNVALAPRLASPHLGEMESRSRRGHHFEATFFKANSGAQEQL